MKTSNYRPKIFLGLAELFHGRLKILLKWSVQPRVKSFHLISNDPTDFGLSEDESEQPWTRSVVPYPITPFLFSDLQVRTVMAVDSHTGDDVRLSVRYLANLRDDIPWWMILTNLHDLMQSITEPGNSRITDKSYLFLGRRGPTCGGEWQTGTPQDHTRLDIRSPVVRHTSAARHYLSFSH